MTCFDRPFIQELEKYPNFRFIVFKEYGMSNNCSTNFLIRMYVLVFQRNVSVMSRSAAELT